MFLSNKIIHVMSGKSTNTYLLISLFNFAIQFFVLYNASLVGFQMIDDRGVEDCMKFVSELILFVLEYVLLSK